MGAEVQFGAPGTARADDDCFAITACVVVVKQWIVEVLVAVASGGDGDDACIGAGAHGLPHAQGKFSRHIVGGAGGRAIGLHFEHDDVTRSGVRYCCDDAGRAALETGGQLGELGIKIA